MGGMELWEARWWEAAVVRRNPDQKKGLFFVVWAVFRRSSPGNRSACSVSKTVPFIAMPRNWVKGNAVGSGSFGVVNLAMNKFTGELFVVKSAASRDGVQVLENEADILENLNSPHIVQCLGRELSKEANGERRLNLFMEFMAGGSLADVAEKFGGALDESVIRRYTGEILKGLVYLHRNGIVHCDLKCKNVLLGSKGNVKLADFGSAKRLDSLRTENGGKTSWQNVSGTPLWMAPEVLRNEGLDFAADIWSLGCTIIEMATGRPPWEDLASIPCLQCSRLHAVMKHQNFQLSYQRRVWISWQNACRGTRK
ncbi:hypothetical protein Scep_002902 [Stephania cephalantha]|uniref:Protein kinase domain-containing protein n=1 Tax=Stephania cephalantha TaxID=152367 RepID=A0AAP0Q982_9MAGN